MVMIPSLTDRLTSGLEQAKDFFFSFGLQSHLSSSSWGTGCWAGNVREPTLGDLEGVKGAE